MKIIRTLFILVALVMTLPALQAQDFLQKAKSYLDAGECDKAQRAYDAYKVEHPSGDAEVQRRIEECKNKQRIVPKGYVDLGLPSGTMWKNKNEEGDFYTYDQAVSKFGDDIPTKAQLEELSNSCNWTWTSSGYKVTGPNGKSITLPAAGLRDCDGDVSRRGAFSGYWSSTHYDSDYAWYLFGPQVGINYRCYGYSVRLVYEK